MYNIKLNSYIPEPNPAKSDRIVAAHYYAAWKKGAAGVHEGFDDLAREYPDRTPLMGYYDEENPEVCDWEIKWATEHGINCFIYCWYRKPENVGKPVSVSSLRAGRGLHEGFLNASFCNKINFSIMYEMQKPWGATDSEDIEKNLMPFWVENYFSRDNYLKIDNKPVLFVYDNSRQFADTFENAGEQKKCFDRLRELAKGYGFDGMYFALEYRKEDMSVLADFKERGYDFTFAYCLQTKELVPDNEFILEEQMRQNVRRLEYDPDFFVPTASCMWDPSPRFHTILKKKALEKPEYTQMVWKLSPENYRILLERLVKATPKDSFSSKMIMLDNWNEWDEGHYIMPSLEFGFKYLQAVREALTECDNLPDYRLPCDIGLEYDNPWGEPDLSHNTHRLDTDGTPYIKVEKITNNS